MRIDVIVGTRPEAIKMAPVIKELKSRDGVRVRVISTGQHTVMLRQALSFFGLAPDVDLDIMRERQSLDYITSAILTGIGNVFDDDMPDFVAVHGDTTTTMAASLAAFYRRIKIAHVEAGLRSSDMGRPFPEEMNRVVTDRLADLRFAPTEGARDNLLAEGTDASTIFVTGNTIIDALYSAQLADCKIDDSLAKIADGRRFILLTAHRRESWGEPLVRICRAAKRISNECGADVLIPMHKNPAVREVITREFAGVKSVHLCEPLDYPVFIWAMRRCAIVLSDSGGVQEEGTALSVPVLIMREVTERPEAVTSGSGIMVGTDDEKIYETAVKLLNDEEEMAAIRSRCAASPFGDGHASERIVDIIIGEKRTGVRSA